MGHKQQLHQKQQLTSESSFDNLNNNQKSFQKDLSEALIVTPMHKDKSKAILLSDPQVTKHQSNFQQQLTQQQQIFPNHDIPAYALPRMLSLKALTAQVSQANLTHNNKSNNSNVAMLQHHQQQPPMSSKGDLNNPQFTIPTEIFASGQTDQKNESVAESAISRAGLSQILQIKNRNSQSNSSRVLLSQQPGCMMINHQSLSLQSTIEGKQQLRDITTDSLSRDDMQAEDKPICQARSSNIFGTTPQSINAHRPKTASMGQQQKGGSKQSSSTHSVSHQLAMSGGQQQQNNNNNNQILAHQLAYGGSGVTSVSSIQLINTGIAANNFSNKQYQQSHLSKQQLQPPFSNSNQSTAEIAMYLKGDSLKSKNGSENMLASDAYMNPQKSYAEQQSVLSHQSSTKNDQTSSAQVVNPQTVSFDKAFSNEKQFKIKQVKGRKVNQVASSTGHRFFNHNSSSANHRKMSAARRPLGSKKAQATSSSQDPHQDHQQQPRSLPLEEATAPKETPFMSYLESFIQQQKMKEDEKLELEDAQSKAQQAANELMTKSFSEYKQIFQQHNQVQGSSSSNHPSSHANLSKSATKNARLFGQNYVGHDKSQQQQAISLIEGSKMTQNSQSAISSHQAQKQIIQIAPPQLHKYAIDTKSNLQAPQLQKLGTQSSSNFQMQIQSAKDQQIQHRGSFSSIPRFTANSIDKVQSQAYKESSNVGATQNVNQDDGQTVKVLLSICRSVMSRTEDIHSIRQSMDIKLRKVRHVNIELFEDIKGREIARVNKENALFVNLCNLKQSDSLMTKRQLIKHTKKIYKVFWNVIEAEEETQDLAQMNKHAPQYMASELNVLEIYSDKGDKYQVFKRSHAIQAKLLEAVFRDKEFELNFSVALGVQRARQTFLNEVNRAANIHIDFIENNPSSIAQIRRATKNISESHYQRRLKIVSVNAKATKMFEFLNACNQEVRDRRQSYTQAYEKKMELLHAKSQPRPSKQGLSNNPTMIRQRSLMGKVNNQTPCRDGSQLNTTNPGSNSRNKAVQQRTQCFLKNQASGSFSIQKSIGEIQQTKEKKQQNNNNVTQPKRNTLYTTMQQLIQHRSSFRSNDSQNNQPTLAKTQIMLKQKSQINNRQSLVSLRKYKWHKLYVRETCPRLKLSCMLKTKNHLKLADFKYFETMPAIFREDLERCKDQITYNIYSMKKGNEHHLTLIVETRVLKIQRMARCFYQTRMRAAFKIQTRLKALYERKHQAPTSVSPSVKTGMVISPDIFTPCLQELMSPKSLAVYDTNGKVVEQFSQYSNQYQQMMKSVKSPAYLAIMSSNKVFEDRLNTIRQQPQKDDYNLQTVIQNKEDEHQERNNRFDRKVSASIQIFSDQRLLRGLNNNINLNNKNDTNELQNMDLIQVQNEQQGGRQILRVGLWDHYGQQHMQKVIFLQRAFRKLLLRLRHSTIRLDLFYDCKFKQLYSVEAFDGFQNRFFNKLKRTYQPKAILDCRQIELQRGLSLHKSALQSFLSSKVANNIDMNATPDSKALAQSGSHKDDDGKVIDEIEWRKFWQQKIRQDIKHRFEQNTSLLVKETRESRKKLFSKQVSKLL